MINPQRKKPGLALPAARQRVGADAAALVTTRPLLPDQALPLLVEPAVADVDPITWAAAPDNRDFVQRALLEHGGLLFRGFKLETVAAFEQFIRTLSGELLAYQERSSPRTEVGQRSYTSTDHPADQSIFLHNEQSYNLRWPLKISFCCLVPARQGGATPIADCRQVFQRIDPAIRARFAARQYMYVRNFGGGFGLSWQTAFQTDDRAEVEDYCRRNAISTVWHSAERLTTRQVRPAIVRHPRSGEPIWFNHLTFFHVTTLEPPIRASLLDEFGLDQLPNNTYYGDGTPIEDAVLDELRAAYHAATVSFPWRQGDVLLLDNMLTAHGRAPFVGPRRVVVAMTEPVDLADLQPLS